MDIQGLKNNIDTIGIINNYTDLEKVKEDEYKGICPFHDDNDASFYLNTTKNVVNCFGCNFSGDIITFIQKIKDLDFKDAVKYLADGKEIDFKNSSDNRLSNSMGLLDLPQNNKKEHKLNEKRIKKYKENMHQYLLDQGFKKETLKFFEVGYCFDASDELYNRITIPWRNTENELVAVVGRDPTDKKGAKYKAKSGSKKNDYLYNLNNSKDYTNEGLIVVEDEKSVIRLWEFGYKNAVALGNKELKDRKWLLRQYTDTAILALDNDDEGIKARNNIIHQLISIINIEVIKLSEAYKDIAEIKDKKIFDKIYKDRDKLNL